MKKKIVGKFNEDFSKVEFYEIIDNYKQYTILRKQGSSTYYVWDNKQRLLSHKLWIIAAPKEKDKYEYIIGSIKMWYKGIVFFWADSKFVTEHGLPHYDKLIEVYKQLISIKLNDIKMDKTLMDIKDEEGFFTYLKCKLLSFRFLNAQKKTFKKLEKEYKLIW